ncbi:MalY/PatB family protein [Desulfoluna spongiiphila]|uniref:cysteine-S-conjugate beta-lyase n=1 Tax=Desulfoluna spongiiphila TaxID=419481 RepID=A0A1G5HGM2_9BACT|nr:PatB family C-S lyase [Desulfoluna spongiiphila]SCY63015.1 cystathione beta-lyase [Desulfoluna spongiiphila]
MHFDRPIDRKGTSSLKWDWFKEDVLPLWVADMDFAAPEAVTTALTRRAGHPVYGYTLPSDALYEAVQGHIKRQFGWTVEREWVLFIPGVVTGFNVAARLVGETEAIAVPTPAYPPFLSAAKNARRQMVKVHLPVEDGRLVINREVLEAQVTPETKLLMLCTPYNPGGTLLTQEELTGLVDFCEARDILICSDEIHADLVLDEKGKHIPTASLSEKAAARTITLMAPSKTFNIPGLGCSMAIISDEKLRTRFKAAMEGIVPHVNLMGYEGATAAYIHGGPWLKEVLAYLRANRDYAFERLAAMKGLTPLLPEATYLIWMDARDLGLDNPATFFEEHGVGLSDGAYFDAPGWLRLNFACTRALLKEALDRMEKALAGAE